MKVTEIFRKVRNSVARYRENQEIQSLQQVKTLAERGLGLVAARGGAVPMQISETEAKKRIEDCNKALSAISKRRETSSPQP